MTINSKEIAMQAGMYTARLLYTAEPEEQTGVLVDGTVSIQVSGDYGKDPQTLTFERADILYLHWLFEELTAEMGVLTGAKKAKP